MVLGVKSAPDEGFTIANLRDYTEIEVLAVSRSMDLEEPIRIPIADVFDLHNVPARDAEAVVEAYLEEAQRLGMKALRIIHGRGIGVQREIVRSVLARTPFVVYYADAPAEAGGWGATVVTLR